ncbi:MAG: ATP-binding cassette domain-containing protein [Myxococcales bacterium]|nr:ATP-binding cassette domain-containing protein [Myxococcales bacterium]
MTALALHGHGKRYRQQPVLEDISIEIQSGEAVALIGPNGAGKSTLLGCVAGTVIADAGRVTIGGHDLASAPLAARAALRYLPQEIELPAGVSGREVLELHAAIFAAPLAPEAIELAALGEALDHQATTYSVGMRRRLLLAALSLGAAALWAVDEPFAGLDRPSQRGALALLRRRLAAGAGLLIAAHDPEDPLLRELGARPLLLEAGRVRAL